LASACQGDGALPLVQQQPADADIEPMACSKMGEWTERHPTRHWRDVLATVVDAINADIRSGATGTATATKTGRAGMKRSCVSASAARITECRAVIYVDSDSDDPAGRPTDNARILPGVAAAP
jgi:hypothetical protein